MSEIEREWWEPVLTDEAWIKHIREEYPDECADLDDEGVRDEYADGLKYQTLWDNLGDARDEHEALADAYFALRARVAELEGALRPFVALWSVKRGMLSTPKNGAVWSVAADGVEHELTVEYFEAARAALAPKEAGRGE